MAIEDKTVPPTKKLVFDLIHRTTGVLSHQAVRQEVKKHHPHSQWRRAHWDWYRSQTTTGKYRELFSEEERTNLIGSNS